MTWAWTLARPLPGISALLWSAPDRRHSGLQTSRGLDITRTATDQHSKTLQRNMNTFYFGFLSFDRNHLFYLCSGVFFLRSVGFFFFCMIVWGGNDSYCKLYIYEFVNSKNGIVGIVRTNAWFYWLRMKIKAQVKGYALALLAGSFVGYCMSLPWLHPLVLRDLTPWYPWQRLGNSSSCRNCAWLGVIIDEITGEWQKLSTQCAVFFFP